MTTTKKYIVLLLVSFLIISGCGGPDRPSDLPKLYPCTISVTQDGKPLGDALVKLVSTEPNFKWAVFAQIGTSGTGKVFTQGLYPGAPEGEYKVVVSKEEETSEKIGSAAPQVGEFGEIIAAPTILTVHTLVEKQYADAETTPLSITISSKGNDKKFDCGKPVKEFLRKVTP
ncbi:MAG: hypothetical protein FWE67_02095 [Planctomycetaceae bacterium]|nr:hypothetical protein [Planctomycetaceae bacterium]